MIFRPYSLKTVYPNNRTTMYMIEEFIYEWKRLQHPSIVSFKFDC